MAITVTPLTRAEIEKQTNAIYVMNNSSGSNERPRGIVFLSMKDGDREIPIQIGATWLPVNMLEFASKDAVLSSVDFRRWIREGVLVAISEAQAEAILDSGEAKQERIRYNETFAEVPGNSKIRSNDGDVTIQTGAGSSPIHMPVVSNAKEPSPKFAELANQFNANTISDDGASEAITNLFRTGAVSIEQLQMGAMLIKNNSSKFYRQVENLISNPDAPLYPTATTTATVTARRPDSVTFP